MYEIHGRWESNRNYFLKFRLVILTIILSHSAHYILGLETLETVLVSNNHSGEYRLLYLNLYYLSFIIHRRTVIKQLHHHQQKNFAIKTIRAITFIYVRTNLTPHMKFRYIKLNWVNLIVQNPEDETFSWLWHVLCKYCSCNLTGMFHPLALSLIKQ